MTGIERWPGGTGLRIAVAIVVTFALLGWATRGWIATNRRQTAALEGRGLENILHAAVTGKSRRQIDKIIEKHGRLDRKLFETRVGEMIRGGRGNFRAGAIILAGMYEMREYLPTVRSIIETGPPKDVLATPDTLRAYLAAIDAAAYFNDRKCMEAMLGTLRGGKQIEPEIRAQLLLGIGAIASETDAARLGPLFLAHMQESGLPLRRAAVRAAGRMRMKGALAEIGRQMRSPGVVLLAEANIAAGVVTDSDATLLAAAYLAELAFAATWLDPDGRYPVENFVADLDADGETAHYKINRIRALAIAMAINMMIEAFPDETLDAEREKLLSDWHNIRRGIVFAYLDDYGPSRTAALLFAALRDEHAQLNEVFLNLNQEMLSLADLAGAGRDARIGLIDAAKKISEEVVAAGGQGKERAVEAWKNILVTVRADVKLATREFCEKNRRKLLPVSHQKMEVYLK